MLTTNAEPRPSIRTCVGCRRRAARSELYRCVIGADGRATVSTGAPGRGAWLCGPGCLEAAVSRRGFERAWRAPQSVTVLEDLSRAFGRLGDESGDDDVVAVRSGSAPHERMLTRAKG